ncbi:MAG: hypothetical protein JOS17DRAFT_730093, partial [Linnemannia elongata]
MYINASMQSCDEHSPLYRLSFFFDLSYLILFFLFFLLVFMTAALSTFNCHWLVHLTREHAFFPGTLSFLLLQSVDHSSPFASTFVSTHTHTHTHTHSLSLSLSLSLSFFCVSLTIVFSSTSCSLCRSVIWDVLPRFLSSTVFL